MESEECKMDENKRMKFSYSSKLFDRLSDNLLIEILVRLPSKSAIQFKTVCRDWYKLISSPDFIRFFNHRRHDRSLPPIHDSDSSLYSLVFRLYKIDHQLQQSHFRYTDGVAEFLGVHSLDLSFLPYSPLKIEFNASCNGLLLCSFKKSPKSRTTDFYVCNPQTKQWVALPPAHHFFGHVTGLLCVPAPCSLCHDQGYGGVDNTNYKFTVVQFPKGHHMGVRSQFKLQLFSSEEGQWRTIVLSTPSALRFRIDSHSAVVAYRGMLHWLKYPYILVFDPYNAPGQFSRVIKLPLRTFYKSVLGFGVCEDCLRVTYTAGGSPYLIWELKDYEMGEWSLVHKLCKGNVEFRDTFDHAPYLYPDGNALCCLSDNSLCISNLQSGVIEYGLDGTHARRFPIKGNFLKIDDQWWPTLVPSLPLNIQS